MHHLVHLGKCLADPTTVRLLACLLLGDMLLPDIQRALKLKVSTLRAKLQMLRACGLIEVENEGRWLRFRLASDRRSLIEQIFSEYDDEIAWDADITAAQKILLCTSKQTRT